MVLVILLLVVTKEHKVLCQGRRRGEILNIYEAMRW